MCTQDARILRGSPFRLWQVRLAIACTAFCGALIPPATGWGQPVLFNVIHTFQPTEVGYPQTTLLLTSDNALLGVVSEPGAVFKMDRDGGNFQVLHAFMDVLDGAGTIGQLIQASDGLVYGTASSGGTNGLGTIFRLSLNGAGYAVLHSFSASDGGTNPAAGLMQAANGLLYGTASKGGISNAGTIFRMNLDGGGFEVLHTFTSTPDGATPRRLMQAANGMLYGTSTAGGTSNQGTIFRLNPDGSNYQVVHSFSYPPEGAGPSVQLVQASDGMLYGTTQAGGSHNHGVVFRMTWDGSFYQIVHHFTNAPDGVSPRGGLTLGPDGTLYGTTLFGGAQNAGSIYRVVPGSLEYSVLYSLTNSGAQLDGNLVLAGLTAGPSSQGQALVPGILYGVASQGGLNSIGTAFGLVINPPIAITPMNNQNVLMWPAWAQHYVLQTSTNVSSGPWVTMTNYVPLIGAQLTNSTVPSNAFFRLVWPQ